MTLGNQGLRLAALAVDLQLATACSDYERFRGRTPEQAKQACDPQRQTSEECASGFQWQSARSKPFALKEARVGGGWTRDRRGKLADCGRKFRKLRPTDCVTSRQL